MIEEITCLLGDLRVVNPKASEKERIMHAVAQSLLPQINTVSAKMVPSGSIEVDGISYYYCKGGSRYAVRIRNQSQKNAAHAKYKRANPEKTKANRIRRNGHSYFRTDYDKQMRIRYCEKIAELNQTTGIIHHLDHIIPLIHGGADSYLNWQILPEKENLSKGRQINFSFKGLILKNDEWIKRPDDYRGEYSQEPVLVW